MSEIIKHDDEIIVRPGRDIVASIAAGLKEELLSIVQDAPATVTIDLEGVEMVDSIGIGVIIATHNSLQKSAKALRIINTSKEIFDLFSAMRLDKHFPVSCKE